MAKGILIDHVFKVFGDRPEEALDLARQGCSKKDILARTGQSIAVFDATFEIQAGEIFVIMGLSGSGKSTLVRLLNRLIEPTAGRIVIDGADINDHSDAKLRALRRKDISMVFQSFALMPHMTVRDNTAFGLELSGASKKERLADGRQGARAGGPGRLGRELSRRAVGRHAAARGPGAGAGVRSVDPADGRGLLGARPDHPHRDAVGTAAAAEGTAPHHRLHLARPRRSHAHRRPHRDHEGRPGGAGRHARRHPAQPGRTTTCAASCAASMPPPCSRPSTSPASRSPWCPNTPSAAPAPHSSMLEDQDRDFAYVLEPDKHYLGTVSADTLRAALDGHTRRARPAPRIPRRPGRDRSRRSGGRPVRPGGAMRRAPCPWCPPTAASAARSARPRC